MPNEIIYTITVAKRKIESFCAYQERCHQEVIQKLRSYKMNQEEIDEILVYLIDNRFLDESRFACSFARGKHRIKKWGKTRITNELKLRDIGSFNIKLALKEIDDEEYIATFEQLSAHAWEQQKEKNLAKKKQKVMGYLLRKGYESHLVYDFLAGHNK